MLSSEFPIMRSSGFRPGPPANRRCAIRRSMPVINDVQRASISQILPGRLALLMSWTAEIFSYKPYEEGKHMTTPTVYSRSAPSDFCACLPCQRACRVCNFTSDCIISSVMACIIAPTTCL